MSFSIAIGIYWEVFKHWIKGTSVVILDVPLLFEAKLNRLTKPIIVVWVDAETQERRLVKRDVISTEQAAKKIGSQLPLDWKRDQADFVIDNSGTLEALKGQVSDVYEKITVPLSWKEVVLSRSGVLTAVVALFSVCLFAR
jgi:dephospho-CoA kinase